LRPGDQAFFDTIPSYICYRTCYYRTFGVGKASVAQKDAYSGRANGSTMSGR
jgi:Xaa-Pro aminopeptidase